MKKTKIKVNVLLILLTILVFSSCKEETKKNVDANIKVEDTKKINLLDSKGFDTIVKGKKVKLYWLEKNDVKLAITNYGGRFVGLWVPDKNGELVDVNIGLKSVKDYIESTEPYFGATIGRVGNRIAKGKFSLEGKEYSIPTNNGMNALHGGYNGFQDEVWEAKQLNAYTLELNYTSIDMEEGFPGNLKVKVTYSLTDSNAVKMEYQATTDKPTVVNLTNHAFFNLNGEGSGTILNHSLQIYSNTFTPVDSGLIPTGELKEVMGSSFDFMNPHTIGERIDDKNKQLEYGVGYDHNYVLNGTQKKGMNHAATVIGDKSGIKMDVYTLEPGIQFYSGNFMESKNVLKSGVKDDFRTAFCLETQHFPDAPNHPNFPSIILNPEEKYQTVSVYEFSIQK
ncbi:aldose epimerase family protein [Aestuariibaculum marinum]|uniref:Aldose 1-epimerase n=1 Tax=Aestuariibaculum marinum TaxID=2683592 RepID=A0A8J6Q829_9FLAO|nr:aldose epimerase family protein [Aestuariibaculum marinum]MBD0825168.1 galactose mutarotase [Aestuariibaculum marinum]